MFGGEAGKAYDANFHSAGDTIDNINAVAREPSCESVQCRCS